MDDIQKTIFTSRVTEIFRDFPENDKEMLAIIRLSKTEKGSELGFSYKGNKDMFGEAILHIVNDKKCFRTGLVAAAASLVLADLFDDDDLKDLKDHFGV